MWWWLQNGRIHEMPQLWPGTCHFHQCPISDPTSDLASEYAQTNIQRAPQCIAIKDFKLKRRIVFQFDSIFRCPKHLLLLPHQMDPLVEARLCTYCICIFYLSLYLCICVRKFAADQARPSDQLSAWWRLTYLRTRWNDGHQVRNFSQPVLRENFCFCNLSGDWRTVIFKQLQQKHSKMVAFQNPEKII